MILKKMIQLCFLLKDIDTTKMFTEIDGKKMFIPEKLAGMFDGNLINRICAIVSHEPANEIDALAGITDFFLQLREQAKASPMLKTLIKKSPLAAEHKQIFSWIVGEI
jgi:hypothetical protein